MLTGIALILLGIYAALPQAISITMIVFGALNCFGGLITTSSLFKKMSKRMF